MKIHHWLETILTWQRPAHSENEQKFVDWLYKTLVDMGHDVEMDFAGNIWVYAGGDKTKTLFTSHTDTVHTSPVAAKQEIQLTDGIISLKNLVQGHVLGADDGAGIYVMLRMLLKGVQADYVFYRAEEVGGIGSSESVYVQPQNYAQYKRAIAFDRKGKTSVITCQGYGVTSSDKFAHELSQQLNTLSNGALNFAPDDTGIFTDTANLVEVVSECTNISVGYESAHTCHETLDLNFIELLIENLVKVNWAILPEEREKGVTPIIDPYSQYSDWWNNPKYETSYVSDLEGLDEQSSLDTMLGFHIEQIRQHGYEYAEELVWSEPEMAVELLVNLASKVRTW